ncbi:hypothetical protein DASC09_000300 [Saccharomycopsis crataegensis]|uniref:Major facilitator superfamily (MFS) profile domain-containing protein n=1 Tax=Saccharomycopsis crataegensis TaxID=43959 RepID=A0AAV5QE38_9ASCO|nr:hypothetical protein DASC09_000300 [Saccharomycopsis crataegensis]
MPVSDTVSLSSSLSAQSIGDHANDPQQNEKSTSSSDEYFETDVERNQLGAYTKDNDTEDHDIDNLSRQMSRNAVQEVPLYMSGVVDDAVSRQISRFSRQPQANDMPIASRTTTRNTITKTKSAPNNYNPDLKLSKFRRTAILVLSALSGFLSPLSNVSFLPAVSYIAKDFHTTGTIINITNAVYMVFMSTSPCIFSPLSDIYGRRPVFLACLVGYVVSSVLTAVSQNLAMFWVFRSATAIFGTAFFSVGAHVIGDLYPPVERGRKIGLNVLGAQLGIAIGPIMGGLVVTWASWRIIFFVLAGVGCFNFVGVFFLMPETARQTGMNQILKETESTKKFVFVPFNPLRILRSFAYPNLILAGFVSSAILYSMYNLLTPIRYVVDPRFHLDTPIYGALFYLAPGVGFILGAYFGGRLSDYTVKKWIKKKGKRTPEDRVRALLASTLFVMPIATIIYGWTLEFEKGGFAVPIIALFFYAFAQSISFPAINTYCVDSMPELKGDAIAGNYFARYMLAIASSASCLPAIQTIGVGWCCTIGGFITFAGGICALILVKFGEKWRKEALVRKGYRKEGEVYA